MPRLMSAYERLRLVFISPSPAAAVADDAAPASAVSRIFFFDIAFTRRHAAAAFAVPRGRADFDALGDEGQREVDTVSIAAVVGAAGIQMHTPAPYRYYARLAVYAAAAGNALMRHAADERSVFRALFTPALQASTLPAECRRR